MLDGEQNRANRVQWGWLTPGIWVVIGLSTFAFLINRHVARPWVLENMDGGISTIMVNSLPNLVEAIIGTIDVAIVLCMIVRSNAWLKPRVTNSKIYVAATTIAGILVIASEMNWIRFRGPNVYDPMDIVASVLGLFTILILITHVGLIAEQSNE